MLRRELTEHGDPMVESRFCIREIFTKNGKILEQAAWESGGGV